jgi:ComF family protein
MLADALAAASWPDFSIPGHDLLVPVPLSRRRLAQRGFNQAALLATRLGRRLRIRVDLGALVRTRHTPSQSSTWSREQRMANVSGAFATKKANRLKDKCVCLIDDVATTGATLSACAATLKAAGAKAVDAVTVARTIRFQDLP